MGRGAGGRASQEAQVRAGVLGHGGADESSWAEPGVLFVPDIWADFTCQAL